MQKVPVFVLLAVLVALFTPRTTHADSPRLLDCNAQSNNLVALGRPMAEARLIASSNPAMTTPPPTVAAPTNPAPVAPAPVTYTVQAGDTLSIIASRYQTTVYALMEANGLQNANIIHRGQVLIIPVAGSSVATNTPLARPAAAAVPAPFAEVWQVGEARQGEAVTLWLKVASGVQVTGKFGTQPIPFRNNCNLLWGMVAFDVFDVPTQQNITLTATAADGKTTTVRVPIQLKEVGYWRGPQIVYPDDRQTLLDPETLRLDNERLNTLFAAIPDSPPLWRGTFQKPINSVVTQSFGSTGTRDGKPVSYHEGVDLRAREPLPFYSAADGIVVLAESMTVRGNVIYVYHGAGVVTGYFHLSQMDVKVGDTVTMGQRLGLTGNTGLSTAPHLHWEMRVNGRWVSPIPWLSVTP